MNLGIAILACLSACGTADYSDEPSAACREHATNAFRTRFVGSNFDTFEGLRIRVLTSIGASTGADEIECRAGSESEILDGAFVARADNLRGDTAYPRLGAFIDRDGDGACSAESDVVWTRLSIAPPPDQEDTIELTTDRFALFPDAEGCAYLRN